MNSHQRRKLRRELTKQIDYSVGIDVKCDRFLSITSHPELWEKKADGFHYAKSPQTHLDIESAGDGSYFPKVIVGTSNMEMLKVISPPL